MNIKKPCIIGVGDNTVDTYVHLRTKFPGGNAVNVAALAHRYGAEAAYLGFVGKDKAAELILNSLQKEGIDISHCKKLEDIPTAYCNVRVVGGDRVFGNTDFGASQHIHLSEDDLSYIRNFDLIHTSAYSFLEDQLAELKAASRLLSYDLSQRCEPEYLKTILPHVDIAFLSLSSISNNRQDQLMREIISYGVKLVVMTRGKEGSWVYNGTTLYHQDILPAEILDTLGAGDAFAARFLFETVQGVPIPVAMERAAQSAAENCTHYGAFGYGELY